MFKGVSPARPDQIIARLATISQLAIHVIRGIGPVRRMPSSSGVSSYEQLRRESEASRAGGRGS
jgi:hypothetical protein